MFRISWKSWVVVGGRSWNSALCSHLSLTSEAGEAQVAERSRECSELIRLVSVSGARDSCRHTPQHLLLIPTETMTTVVGHQPACYHHLDSSLSSFTASSPSSSSSDYDLLDEYLDLDMSLRRSQRLSKLSYEDDDEDYSPRLNHYSGGSVTIVSPESSYQDPGHETSVDAFQDITNNEEESPASPKVCLPSGKNIHKKSN